MLEKNLSGLFIAEIEAVWSNTQRTELVTCVTNFLCFYSPRLIYIIQQLFHIWYNYEYNFEYRSTDIVCFIFCKFKQCPSALIMYSLLIGGGWWCYTLPLPNFIFIKNWGKGKYNIHKWTATFTFHIFIILVKVWMWSLSIHEDISRMCLLCRDASSQLYSGIKWPRMHHTPSDVHRQLLKCQSSWS